MMVAAALVGLALLARNRVVVGCALCALAVVLGGAPLAVGCAATVACFVAWKRARATHSAALEDDRAEIMAIEVASLGVAAGLSYDQAVSEAAGAAGGTIRSALERALRGRAIRQPSTTGFAGLDAMESEAQRSAITGSPLGPGLDGLARAIRRDRAAEEAARLARLPVKLVFPLALLVLPGFVLMTVGPAVLGGLARLDL